MHIISVDMMIDDSCCLVRGLLLLVVQSVVIVEVQATGCTHFVEDYGFTATGPIVSRRQTLKSKTDEI